MPHFVEFVLPPSLAAGLTVRYQPRVVRSPATHTPGVRSGRSCHTLTTRPEKSSVRPAVGSCLMRGLRGRVVSLRHARPAAHTLRTVVRPATLSGSSAHMRSIGQRRRQTHPRSASRCSHRLPAAPPAACTRQCQPGTISEPRQSNPRPNLDGSTGTGARAPGSLT
jgi:hypothetical protein